MSTISSISNTPVYNPQYTNKVAATDSSNLANNAANQSAFSSYIGQALAQIGVANPTNSSAPVISSANRANSSEKSLGTFIQDLFSILSNKETSQQPNNSPTTVDSSTTDEQTNLLLTQSAAQKSTDNSSAITAYNAENSTTVGNIVNNLKTLVNQLNNQSSNTGAGNGTAVTQTLQNDFQSILDAQGANTTDKMTLGNFLQTLAQNLQGQSPLGIIVNTTA